MNKEKRIWIALFLALTLMLILSGCSGLPKTAKINITTVPNLVPYSSENENWTFDIVLDESNGVGVTLSSLRWDEYNQEEQLIYTTIWYEADEEEMTLLFGSNYLPAFSSLQGGFYYYIGPGAGYEFAKYTVLTIEGVDDNENLIEATGRVYYLPQ
jgi:hypothetical protein